MAPEPARVRRRLPRRRLRRRASSPRSTRRTREREVHHQLVDAGATRARDDPDVPRDGHCAAAEGTGGRGGVRASARPTAADVARPIAELRRAARRAGAGRSRRRRRAAVLVGHDRPVEGRDAHAPQPRRERRADARHRRACARTTTFVAVLPFFHIYGMQVLMNTGLRAGATIVTMPRFDLEQFLRAAPGVRPHPRRSSRRRWSSRWPSTRSSTTTTSPRCGRSSPARRRCRPSSRSSAASGSAARSCRATA